MIRRIISVVLRRYIDTIAMQTCSGLSNLQLM